MTPARGVVFVVASWLLVIVQSSVASLLPWHGIAPEVALLVVLYVGFYGRGSATANAGLALTIGYLADLLAASPRGLHALTFGLVVLAARGASNRLMVASTWQVLVVTLATALGHGALMVALTSSMYADGAGGTLWLVPLTAGATCLAAPLVFLILKRIDRRLAPDERMRFAL
jgi:rod shape-determining protein MreD